VVSQLLLLPDAASQLRRESLPLDAIDGFAEATPSAKLRELIRDLGLLQPVVATPTPSGRYELIEGRRRCKAIVELTALASRDCSRRCSATRALAVSP
jgi:ParB-like chromosome segregation protein Spo0J